MEDPDYTHSILERIDEMILPQHWFYDDVLLDGRIKARVIMPLTPMYPRQEKHFYFLEFDIPGGVCRGVYEEKRLKKIRLKTFGEPQRL